MLSLLTVAGLMAGMLYFGGRRAGYSAIRHTISELGERGAADAGRVNYGFFLPIGVLLALISWLTDDVVVRGIAGGLALAYLAGVLFPCDPGAPLWGSWRQQVHTIGGMAGYAIALVTLFHYGLYSWLYVIILSGMLLTAFPLFPFRGLAQRIAELLLLGDMLHRLWLVG